MNSVATKQKVVKVSRLNQNQLEDHLASNEVNYLQVRERTGDQKETFREAEPSRSKHEQRLTSLQKTGSKIVEQFQNKAPETLSE